MPAIAIINSTLTPIEIRVRVELPTLLVIVYAGARPDQLPQKMFL